MLERLQWRQTRWIARGNAIWAPPVVNGCATLCRKIAERNPSDADNFALWGYCCFQLAMFQERRVYRQSDSDRLPLSDAERRAGDGPHSA